MPFTFGHLPFIFLLFLMIVLPLLPSLAIFAIPQFRQAGKKMVFGVGGATIGLVVHQLVFIPLWLLGLVLFAIIERFTGNGGDVFVTGALIVTYPVWFLFLLVGYVSGFRIGWRTARSAGLLASLKLDFLTSVVRVALSLLRGQSADAIT